jgi:hypothetical protein
MEEICWMGLKGCSYIRIKIPERIAVHGGLFKTISNQDRKLAYPQVRLLSKIMSRRVLNKPHGVLVPLGEDAYRLAVPRDYSQRPWLSGAGGDAA